MNQANRIRQQLMATELERVIEPLANYICATEQPKSVLKSALAALYREVETTQRMAVTHCRTISAI